MMVCARVRMGVGSRDIERTAQVWRFHGAAKSLFPYFLQTGPDPRGLVGYFTDAAERPDLKPWTAFWGRKLSSLARGVKLIRPGFEDEVQERFGKDRAVTGSKTSSEIRTCPFFRWFASITVLKVVAPVFFMVFIRTLKEQTGLADNRPQRAGARLSVLRLRYGDRALFVGLLHHYMAALSPHLHETMRYRNPADFPAGKNAQPSRRRPRRGLHRLRCAGVCRSSDTGAIWPPQSCQPWRRKSQSSRTGPNPSPPYGKHVGRPESAHPGAGFKAPDGRCGTPEPR